MPQANRWLVLGIVSVALLLIVIDMTVLYTALPRLTHELAATASAKLWIINIYPLIVSGLLLGMGTLGDRLGHRRLFMAGLVVFGLASLAAAFSPSASALIAARAWLAVGAAMMMPATLSLIRLTFEDERERAIAIGIWASVASGGAAFGPVLGGVLLEHFWWGAVFLINVPIVALALPLTWWCIPARPGTSSRPWDWLGSLQAMVGLIAVAFAVKEVARREPQWGLAAVALVLGIAVMVWFVRRQRQSPHPMIDFALLRLPVFRGAVLAAVVAASTLIGLELVLSQHLQLVTGLSPLEAGLFLLPLPLGAFVAGPCAGWLLPRVGSQRLLASGLLVSGIGMAACVTLQSSTGTVQLLALAVLGLGLGATMTAASSTIMQSAPPDRAGMAAAIEEVSYELGGAIGVALLGSLLSLVYTMSLVLPAGSNAPATVRDSLDEALLYAEGLTPAAAEPLVALARLAFMEAYLWVVVVCAVVLLLSAVGVWFLGRRVPNRVLASTAH